VVDATARLLRERGHEVVEFVRSSAEIEHMRLGKVRAFFCGVYSRRPGDECSKSPEGAWE